MRASCSAVGGVEKDLVKTSVLRKRNETDVNRERSYNC
jgi:hypothetical protein